jgi:integrase/recombinase XerD
MPALPALKCTPIQNSPRRIQQLVQETAALAGIAKRVHPHVLRHSVATTLLERGMPLEQLQQFLGHAKLETTQSYAASTTAMIKESYQKALGRCARRCPRIAVAYRQ